MKKSQKILFLLIIIALVVGGGYFLWDTRGEQLNSLELANEVETDTQVTETGGVYTNEEYGFRFAYPEEWHIGADNLGQGALQLFNYDESEANSSMFSEGMNKIEAIVVAGNPYESSSDYPEKTHEMTEIKVAGQEASRTEIELVGGEKMLGYLIPLTNSDEKFLAVTIYGDPLNFYVLEDLTRGFTFVE